MRKTIRYIAFAGVAHLIAWTTVTAQIGVDSLPEGLPTDDIEYLGDNQFSSGVFGDFELDTTNNKRVIHEILGPMVWDWDEETEIVTLHTEWYGALYSHVPGVSEEKMHASGLGFTWPLVKSEITGFTYHVKVDADMTDPERTPFYNHREVDGEPVGWQRSIGVDLYSAKNYYKSAEVVVGQMQQVLQNMVNAQEAYVNLPVSIAGGQGPIDNQFEQLNAMFLNLHDLYTKFVFYYHRCSMAPVWAERDERPQAEIDLAQAYVNQLPHPKAIAEQVYANAQEILYTNAFNIKTAKMNQLNELIAEEEARRKAEEEANKGGGSSGGGSSGGGSSGGGSSGGGSSGGGSSGGPIHGGSTEDAGSSWEDAIILGPVASDVMSWKKTIELHSVSFGASPNAGMISVQFPSSKPTPWVYDRQADSVGNWWLIQKIGDRYYATTMDYFRPNSFFNNWAPQVFWEHLSNGRDHGNGKKSTPGVAPMVYRKGETYGLMVSTLARLSYRTTNERSNIILFTMP